MKDPPDGISVIEMHERQMGDKLEDEVMATLEEAGFDMESREPPVSDFMNLDALEDLTWSNPYLEIRTRVWGKTIRITDDRIVVYSPAD